MNLNRKPYQNPHGDLDDTSPMPGNGIYAGRPMAQVPVEYLHHMWQSGFKENPSNNVAAYIRKSLSALKKENPDLIWS